MAKFVWDFGSTHTIDCAQLCQLKPLLLCPIALLKLGHSIAVFLKFHFLKNHSSGPHAFLYYIFITFKVIFPNIFMFIENKLNICIIWSYSVSLHFTSFVLRLILNFLTPSITLIISSYHAQRRKQVWEVRITYL